MFIPFAVFSALEAPDERAALLAYKTTVAFPTRLSTAGFLSQGVALGEHDQSRASSEESITGADAKRAESVTDDSAKAETESYDVGAAAEATPVAETATEKDTSPPSADVEAPKSKATPKDDDTSSSSSSSDSDSDSDSDDEKPDKTEKPEPVAKTGDKPGQEEMLSSVSKQPSSDVKTGAVLERVQPCFADEALKGAVKRAPQAAEAVSEPTSKEVPAPSTAAAPAEEIIDPAHVLCTAESIKTQAEVIPEKEAGAEVKSSEVPDAVTEGAPDVAAGHAPEAVLDSAPKAASEAGLEIKAAPETMQAVTPAEELGDPAPVITAAEGVRAEPEVAAAPEGTHYITLKILFTPQNGLLTT